MAVATSIITVATEHFIVTTTISSSSTTFAAIATTSEQIIEIYTSTSGQGEFVLLTEERWEFTTSPTTTIESFTTSVPASVASSSPSSASRPSTATTRTAHPTQAHANSSLSRGATAGIAVGCAVAGLLLGLIAGFLLFRRRKRQRPDIAYQTTQFDSQEKPLQVVPADRLELDQFLLDSTPDADIRAELRSLNHLLSQHVDNNYHLKPVSHSASELSQVLLKLGLGQDGAMTALKLATLSLNPPDRYFAIQHIIAKVVFASVAFNEASPYSLLPQPVSLFTSTIPAVEGRSGNANAVNTALTRWRQLSAFLLHPKRSDRTPLIPPEDVSTHKAQQLAMNLNAFLESFVAGGREERYEQENHLREVIAEITTFGYRLLSEPSEYRFRFEDGVSPNTIVICPGLDRISDEEGRRYPPPGQPIVAPVVESI
ncbi:hypothetical protein GGR53DRAFT_524329 [Hypoxylon sp. FL1150]|nr:hypothetical protein GGR53DRAFT_524329 [Hypoxylon sp. FL1150]